jgi:hypothetical protein
MPPPTRGWRPKLRLIVREKSPYYHYLALFVYQLVKTGGEGCWPGVLLCMCQYFGSGLDPDSIGSVVRQAKIGQKKGKNEEIHV